MSHFIGTKEPNTSNIWFTPSKGGGYDTKIFGSSGWEDINRQLIFDYTFNQNKQVHINALVGTTGLQAVEKNPFKDGDEVRFSPDTKIIGDITLPDGITFNSVYTISKSTDNTFSLVPQNSTTEMVFTTLGNVESYRIEEVNRDTYYFNLKEKLDKFKMICMGHWYSLSRCIFEFEEWPTRAIVDGADFGDVMTLNTDLLEPRIYSYNEFTFIGGEKESYIREESKITLFKTSSPTVITDLNGILLGDNLSADRVKYMNPSNGTRIMIFKL